MKSENVEKKRRLEGRQELGKRGEEAAVAFLVGKGYRLIERNYRTRAGEIDIIAFDGETLVFVEVRARTSSRQGNPFETVTRSKQEKLIKMARWFLAARGIGSGVPCRFDVIGLLPGADGRLYPEHVTNAFQVGW
ncbi:MAG: YraN family protein [Candidatus Ozemobacteraceae bacterium]